MNVHAGKDRFAEGADKAAAAGRAIQSEIDRAKKARGKPKTKSEAMQAGARKYPEPPLPCQHLKKPGTEAELDLQPMYDAPHYLGSQKLKGKVALVTGADSGIGRSVLKTNLYGYFHMAKAAVPHMKPGSAIVMTGSVTGLLGNKNLSRLLDDEGGHPRVRAVAGDPSHRQGNPCECCGAGTGVDAAQPG
jgi:hypothetical protein